ncbi:nucleotidyl transferase AbiEii/AbiGii toxin family protein [Streptomyces spirodelae]|uniref:Nucleotidyl transferase AbiEii/AbiGii toxin family protein n=1 Tax=Streptomyces spirodelae TaxID=2812904 RepID=A0ABS3WZW4_9ACTN|nr:nucleotidyl transferase AbiEii/AbiGii toxin family protein [Streptomyces spirodelae]MBO8188674.1 nucleotidyl transferase AbiEii/AbiGii toxin family protein [Streptomyces spirodelae]
MNESAWEELGHGPWSAEKAVPQQVPDEATRNLLRLPPTLRPVTGEAVVQRAVFDPSAVHYANAMRLGNPQFADPATGERWYAARRRALDLALAAVADSPWAVHLVLRGSVLLRAWYGAAAREPGDLDFVVEPADWQLADERTERMLEQLARHADLLSRRADGDVRLDSRGAVHDEIWTYDRVPGRRLVVPWTAEGLPGGAVQLDFVFNEPLPAPAVTTPIPRPAGAPGGGATLELRAASRELSLAWKILWLASDMHPEAKDLYDAVLLAEDEQVSLPYELLRAVFRGVDHGYFDRNPLLLDWFGAEVSEHTDWSEFAKEYPHLDIPGADCGQRLVEALRPTFALDDDGSGEPARYQAFARWLAPLTAECRTAFAAGGLPAVLELLFSQYVPPGSALVVAREVLGRDQHALAGLVPQLAAFRPVSLEAGPRGRRWEEQELTEAAEMLAKAGG